MNDQPPPGSEKKPRRRGPPRKRSPAKATTQAANARNATADAAEAVATDGAVESGAAAVGTPAAEPASAPTAASTDAKATGAAEPASTAPAVTPDAVAVRLDPAPLRDSGAPGDAPAEDAPTAAVSPPAAETRGTASLADGTPAMPSARPPLADAASPPPAVPQARDASPPASPPSPAPAATPTAAPMRQTSLRPGELIRVPLSVRWRDLDAFNHVNNSKYLSYLEEARLRWMLTVPGMGLDEHVAPVVAASNLNYRRPIEWPGDVVIELFVERIGGSSLTIGHRIVDSKDGGALYCDGHVVMVWIDRESGRSAPLPESVRAACR